MVPYLGRIACWWRGKHVRGKLLSKDQTHKTFACPRCGRNTIYAIKEKA